MKKIYKIVGIDCANCAQKLEEKLNKKFPGLDCSINFVSERMTVDASTFENKKNEILKLMKKIEPEAEIS